MRGTIAAALVAACLLAGCSDDGDDDGDTGLLDALETAGPAAGDLLVYGEVLDDGKPAKDVHLEVHLWPEGEMDTMEEGESFELYEIEADVEDGRYAVSVDPDKIPSAYWPAGQDFLNFQAVLIWEGNHASWNTTVYRVDGKGWRSDGARIGDPALRMDFDVTRETVRMTESNGTMTEESLPL